MAGERFERRRRTSADSVVSPGEASGRLGMTRQGVAKAVKGGRIPGFQDPQTNRIWIERRYVDEHDDALAGPEARARLGRLEKRIEDLAAAVETLTAGGGIGGTSVIAKTDPKTDSDRVPQVESDVARLRVELVEARAVNVELNTAVSLSEGSDAHRRKAAALLAQAVHELQQVDDLQAAEISVLRSAVGQTQLPGDISGVGQD